MTIGGYIKSKFQSFGITLSEADIFDIARGELIDNDITSEAADRVAEGIVRFIPSLLLRPKSISEGGMGLSYDTKAIKEYYSMMCRRMNLPNELENIKDGTDLW